MDIKAALFCCNPNVGAALCLVTLRGEEDPNLSLYLKSQGVVYPHILAPIAESHRINKPILTVGASPSWLFHTTAVL